MSDRAHRPRRRRGLGLLAVLLTCGAVLAPAVAAARGLPTGVTNTSESSLTSFETVRSTGASYVKIPLDWNSTAPANPPSNWQPEDPNDPNYNWSQWDQQVIAATQAGLTPVLQIGGPPQWAQGCSAPQGYEWAACDPNPADVRAFATAAARHFSGNTPGVPAVRYWQVFNEPNLSLFFLPQYDTSGKLLSPTLYRQVLNAGYAGIKSVSSSNVVILAGLGPIAVPKFTIGPMQFARQLLCMTGGAKPRKAAGNCEGGVHFDVFAIQPYTTGGPTHEGGPNDVELGDLQKLQKLIAAADKAGRIKGNSARTPLWITEFSWDSKPPDPGGLAMKIETRWVAEALYVAWKAKVANFFWYSLRDAPLGRSARETYQSGLFFEGSGSTYQPKPLLTAFRFPFVAYPGKALTFWGRTPTSKPGSVAVQVLLHGHWKTVGKAKANASGIFSGKVATRYGRDHSGAARAVFAGSSSASFSMRPVRDFYHPPFG